MWCEGRWEGGGEGESNFKLSGGRRERRRRGGGGEGKEQFLFLFFVFPFQSTFNLVYRDIHRVCTAFFHFGCEPLSSLGGREVQRRGVGVGACSFFVFFFCIFFFLYSTHPPLPSPSFLSDPPCIFFVLFTLFFSVLRHHHPPPFTHLHLHEARRVPPSSSTPAATASTSPAELNSEPVWARPRITSDSMNSEFFFHPGRPSL